jgi:gliding motility-associated-like protein
VTGGNSPFRFSADGGQSFQTNALIANLVPGEYSLVVSDANGCTASEDVTIEAPFLPTLDISDVLKIEQGDSVLLSPSTNIPAQQVATWGWSPAEGLSCDDCAQPWATPLFSQYYTVTVEDLNGCKAVERVLVQVSRRRHIYPPTVFSPNGDGENDRFTLYAKGVREIRSLAIFDRWGEEVFVRRNFPPNDESLGWDGSFRGSPLNPGVFVWAAEVEFLDGTTEVIYGDVTILR